jgi:hypothetical protein
MVTYGDVGRRHAVYAVALFEVILLSKYTVLLTALLLVDLAIVRRHMNTPYAFTGITMLCTPVAASLCVTLSHHTWWYAHGMPLLAIPSWTCPMHGLFAHWALDAYWLVTLRDVRKSTLPGSA